MFFPNFQNYSSCWHIIEKRQFALGDTVVYNSIVFDDVRHQKSGNQANTQRLFAF